jgi:hypothetical protein
MSSGANLSTKKNLEVLCPHNLLDSFAKNAQDDINSVPSSQVNRIKTNR